MVIQRRFLVFISTFFVLTAITNAQSNLKPLDSQILFEEKKNNSILELTQNEDQVNLKFNGAIKFTSNLNSSSRVNFVQSQSKKYSALILYSFLTKDSKSNFSVHVFDSEIRLVYKKDFEFFYEEPLPIIKINDSGKLIFLTPSDGAIQLIDENIHTRIFLEVALNFNQERLGTMEIFNDTILVSLSSVPSEDNSTTYTLDSNLKIISKQNHPYQFITKCIPLERNKHLISAYNFEDGPKPYLFLVEKDKISALGNVLPIKILINSKLIIVDLKTIYEVNDNKLIRKYELDSESVIKDVIFYLDKIYLLVERKETDECLILNDMYGLENRISIGKSFGNSKLFYSNKIEKLLLINQNKFYLIN